MKRRDDWPERPTSEAELCERFAVLARAAGWVVYPETGGFDQLLVREDGTQIGVEAKLRCSYEVLLQAAPPLDDHYPEAATEFKHGPDYRCVLVPDAVAGFIRVAAHMGLGHYELRRLEEQSLMLAGEGLCRGRLWPTSGRLSLPDYVPDLPAGVPSPKRMSRWLVSALRICKLLRERGTVTIYDFEEHRIHMGLWSDRWLERTGETVPGRRGRRVSLWRAKPGARLPDEDVPERAPANGGGHERGDEPPLALSPERV